MDVSARAGHHSLWPAHPLESSGCFMEHYKLSPNSPFPLLLFLFPLQILLSELGYDEGFIDSLRLDYLMPIAHLLYPKWVGRGLDSHRAFVVQYSVGKDVDLSYHFDNAEVTLNVCLGKSFVGGKLYFGPVKGVNIMVLLLVNTVERNGTYSL